MWSDQCPLSGVGQLSARCVDSGSDSRIKKWKVDTFLLRLLYHHQPSVKNFPDDISMMKMSQCRVNNGDDTNIRAVTDIVVDDELEVGDVDQGQTLWMLLKPLFIKVTAKNKSSNWNFTVYLLVC